MVYEVRNSQIHDSAIHRIKHLERVLGFRPATLGLAPQGMFSERGGGEQFWRLISVRHDVSLSLIYGIVLGAWSYVCLTGLAFATSNPDSLVWKLSNVVVPVAVVYLSGREVLRQAGRGRPAGMAYTLADTCGKLGDAGLVIDELRELETRAAKGKNKISEAALSDPPGSEALVRLAYAIGLIEGREKVPVWPWKSGHGERPQRTLVTVGKGWEWGKAGGQSLADSLP